MLELPGPHPRAIKSKSPWGWEPDTCGVFFFKSPSRYGCLVRVRNGTLAQGFSNFSSNKSSGGLIKTECLTLTEFAKNLFLPAPRAMLLLLSGNHAVPGILIKSFICLRATVSFLICEMRDKAILIGRLTTIIEGIGDKVHSGQSTAHKAFADAHETEDTTTRDTVVGVPAGGLGVTRAGAALLPLVFVSTKRGIHALVLILQSFLTE